MQRVFPVPYDPFWADEFARESSMVAGRACRQAGAMGSLLVAIHPIGTTSIPGIHAKPVIDMLAAARDQFDVDPMGASDG